MAGEHLLHRDNTFGTPEEDAFRRDFTINALFYDIATFSIIDYVDGLEDLRAGIVRSIGDPEVRFLEDPVRMLRAVALAARLDFTIDADLSRRFGSIATRSRAARRRGCSRSTTRSCARDRGEDLPRAGGARAARAGVGRAPRGADEPLWRSLAAVDAYRRDSTATPETFTNPVLLGSLIVPLGLPAATRSALVAGRRRASGATGTAAGRAAARTPRRRALGHVLGLQRRLRDVSASPRGAAGAHPPPHLPRGADLARDSRRRARAGGALEGNARRGAVGRRPKAIPGAAPAAAPPTAPSSPPPASEANGSGSRTENSERTDGAFVTRRVRAFRR